VGFIVGFNRDRDSYEVPAGLAERGILDRFVTDYYAGASRPSMGRLSHRRHDLIDPSLVRTSKRALISQLAHEIRGRAGYPGRFPVENVDDAIGRTLRRLAANSPSSDLLVYAGYARQAFRLEGDRTKLLYQFHPSQDGIQQAMNLDELGSFRPWRREPEFENVRYRRVFEEELRLSNGILAASTFTARSLVASGASPDQIRVTPYGVPAPLELSETDRSGVCRFVFVGQGVQRKGLHTLLVAWSRARLRGAELCIVGPSIDPEIAALAEGLDSVVLLGKVSSAEKKRLLARSDTLVLPSLVEGFGLVLGEALASGCRLIGSRNTGLIDLNLPATISTVIEPGLVEPLVEALRSHRETFTTNESLRAEALQSAAGAGWDQFRYGVSTDALALRSIHRGEPLDTSPMGMA